MGKLFAIVNQKGGVGKTTTAVNLSAALHELGLRTLLCDFDPQANATSGLGIEKRQIKRSVYDVILNGVPSGMPLSIRISATCSPPPRIWRAPPWSSSLQTAGSTS